jgi:hypothetical protein
MEQGSARQRVTVGQAAQVLGLTVDGVRSRIKRGTIAHERVGKRVFVLLDAEQARPVHEQAAEQAAGQAAQDLTAELRDRLRYVEGQLEHERAAHSEARRLLAAALERIPAALEAPADGQRGARGSPEPGEGQQGSSDAPTEPQAATQRPWWRRVFGG